MTKLDIRDKKWEARRIEISNFTTKNDKMIKSLLERKIKMIHSENVETLLTHIYNNGGMMILFENDIESLEILLNESKHKKELYQGLIDLLQLENEVKNEKRKHTISIID